MKQLIRRLSRVADSTPSYSLLHHSPPASRCSAKHRHRFPGGGGVPVYVGEGKDMERFVVSAHLFNHPVFVNLLNRSAQEYGYRQQGALRIPCNVVVFERLLDALLTGGCLSYDLYELVNESNDRL